MERKAFLEKVGKTSLGVILLSVIHPRTVSAGVEDNTNLNKIIGHSDISNVGDGTITGAIGNEALQTSAQTLSGAINEVRQNSTDEIAGRLNNCSLGYANNHFYATYKAGTAEEVSCRLDY